jgi:hypothetical protein
MSYNHPSSQCGSSPPNQSPPPAPPQQCDSAPQQCDSGCDAQHAALIDLDVGTTNGLQIDLDALGINVADVSIGLDLTDGLLCDLFA